MDITTIASLTAVIISVLSFFFNRKDKSNNEVKEEAGDQSLIKYRLDKLDEKVDKILNKLDDQENDIRKVVQDEMDKHLLRYHSKEYKI